MMATTLLMLPTRNLSVPVYVYAVPEPNKPIVMLPLFVTLPLKMMLAPEVVGLKTPVVSIHTSPSVPAPEIDSVPLIWTAPTTDGEPPYVTVLPSGMIARSDDPGMPFGSHVVVVFQLALLVAVYVAAPAREAEQMIASSRL